MILVKSHVIAITKNAIIWTLIQKFQKTSFGFGHLFVNN